MKKRHSRPAPGRCLEMESLEARIVLSSIRLGSVYSASSGHYALPSMRIAPTHTSLGISAGTLAQPVTFSVTVRAPAAAGSPVGTVNLSVHGNIVQTLTLTPATSTDHRYAISQATLTVTPQPGGPSNFFGKYSVKATFVPGDLFTRSSATRNFTISQPQYTTLSNGVSIATVVPGSGPKIQNGQTAGVLYTGYLANGQVFDSSLSHGGTPLTFTLGAGQLIPGFDTGTAGMQVGETRIIMIPPSQGYGSVANGTIPANSTLIFVVTLASIS